MDALRPASELTTYPPLKDNSLFYVKAVLNNVCSAFA